MVMSVNNEYVQEDNVNLIKIALYFHKVNNGHEYISNFSKHEKITTHPCYYPCH